MATKMRELKEAYNQNHGRWKQYEQDASEFVGEFRKQFAEYLKCEVKSVQLLQVSDDFNDERHRKTSLNKRMWLDNDAYWHFFLRLVLEWQRAMPPITHHDVPNKWLQMGFSVRPTSEGAYSVLIPPDSMEIEVREGDFTQLLEATYQFSMEFLENEFQQFIDGGKRQADMGFSISRE